MKMLFKSTASYSDELTHEYFPPKKFILKDGVDSTAAISKGGHLKPFPTARKTCVIPEGGSIVVDFGEEISGGVRLVFHKNQGTKIRITFGETCAEALAETDGNSPPCDFTVRDTVLTVPSLGSIEYARLGFRFVRLLAVDGELSLMGLFARADFLKLPWLGSFEASDKRLNEIWRVAARTLHLNMQDVLLGGIKRVGAVNVGSMHPAARASLALFGDTKCVRDTLDFLRDTTPKGAWMNGYPAFSLRWVIIQHELFMQSGDTEYLKSNLDCILGILSQFAKYVSSDGSVMGLDNFIDPSMRDNNSAKDAAFGAVAVMAFEKGAYLCRALGGEELGEIAERLEQYRKRLHRHSSWSVNKQAVAMQVLSGQKTTEEAQGSLIRDTARSISPVFGYYVLLALSRGGNTKHALDTVKKYWGAMLELGATAFFESFELSEVEGELPPLKIDTPPTEGFKNIYAKDGAHLSCDYERSLAHSGAAGPLAWIAEHLIGVRILEPGCRRVEVKPNLAGLSWLRGTYPTPMGNIEISVTKTDGEPQVEIVAPEGVEIVR